MEWMFIGIVVFLFLLAAFDLYVGVSNDAVNFLNSAIGSKAARFSRLVVIASAGVLIGCIFSNGMMDIARHGIFSPQYFSFHDVMLRCCCAYSKSPGVNRSGAICLNTTPV